MTLTNLDKSILFLILTLALLYTPLHLVAILPLCFSLHYFFAELSK